ncbi:MAG: hypothetical protein ABI580_06885 [Burkholderiaceae bacterium]
MKALTFVSMILLATSGATAQPSTVQAVDAAPVASFQVKQADLAVFRICMRCLIGG